MRGTVDAFQKGLSRSVRYWPLILILFLVNLFSAVVLAAFPAAALFEPARRTAIADAADGIDAWLVTDFLFSLGGIQDAIGEASVPLSPSPAAQRLLWATLLPFALAPLLAWLPNAFLYGGLLLTFLEAPKRVQWGRFLWGCWRWFGSFLALGLVQGLLVLVLYMPLVGLGLYLMNAIPLLSSVFLLLLALLTISWLALFELAQVLMVAEGTRNPLMGLGLALRFMLNRRGAWLALYALAVLLLLAVHLLFRVWLLPALPLAVWWLVLIVQQAFIILRLWAQTARLAGAATLVKKYPAPVAVQPAEAALS